MPNSCLHLLMTKPVRTHTTHRQTNKDTSTVTPVLVGMVWHCAASGRSIPASAVGEQGSVEVSGIGLLTVTGDLRSADVIDVDDDISDVVLIVCVAILNFVDFDNVVCVVGLVVIGVATSHVYSMVILPGLLFIKTFKLQDGSP